MKKKMFSILMLTVIVFIGCSDDNGGTGGGESYTIADLAGIWEMLSVETTVYYDGQAQESENIVSDSSNSSTITVYADGSYTQVAVDDGYSDTDSGVLTLDGIYITVTSDGGTVLSGTLSISDNVAIVSLSYSFTEENVLVLVEQTTIYQKVDSDDS